MPTLIEANKFLQRDEPLIHVLLPFLEGLLKTMLGNFVKPAILAESLKQKCVTSIDFRNMCNQVSSTNLSIGYITQKTVHQLHENGDIMTTQMSAFYSAARDFLATACDYLIIWCPFQEEIVHHAAWLDFEHRLDKPFSSVEYFIVRYSSILTSIDLNKLEAQFLNYQLVDEEQIPEYVKVSG